jgi:2-dehydropantoate 2-reductase
MRDAAPWLTRLCGPRTVVVVQNGIDQADRVAPLGLPGPVLPAIASISAQRDAPDKTVHTFGDRLMVPRGTAPLNHAPLAAASPA